MSAGRIERLQVMLDAYELKALDDWRFVKRMPSRSAAVREIIRRGLAAEGFAEAMSGQNSASFGIIDSTGAEASLTNGSDKSRK
jgi:metal-responsive CopG/Arc/MetJ family transcriptional regulator